MEANDPITETRASKRRKTQRIWLTVGGSIAVVGLVSAMVAYGISHPTGQNFQPQVVTSTTPTENDNSRDANFAWPSWFTFGAHHGNMSYDKLADMAKPLELLALIMLLGGSGLFVYSQRTRRKFLEFDKLGILVTDARKRESQSAKFIPWGCLERIEVCNFDLKKDISKDADEATLESSKAKLLFHVDDGNIVEINWIDVVRCVEPGPFINSLKTYAPEACPQFDALAGDAHAVDKNTYTQLWFRYYSTGSERKRTTQLVEGETLQEGRYEVGGQIGGGGQGTAYVAVDKEFTGGPQEVVLKEYIMPVHRGQQVLQQTVQKLEQEAAILRKIDHANIVKMFGSFVEDHRGYLVMEFVHGKQLKDIVANQGPQPEHVVMDIARQICDVLSYLHCQDPAIIHRDLTPDNLILQDDGRIKLVDFNVAHQLESAATATVVGKHCYIPPEQFRGKPTLQSDIYAFGCTLHYLLTGLEPEPLTVSRPKQFNQSVSDEMNAVIAKATALDATKRFASVAEMHEALNTAPSAKIKVNQNQNVNA